MGRDKAQLPFAGRTLIDHALGTLEEAGFSAAIAGLRGAMHPFVPDEFAEAGPLGGIEAALRSLAEEAPRPALFVPVDLPLLPPAFLRHLFARAEQTGALATIPFAEGRPQPLCAVYSPVLAPAIRRSLAGGDRKVVHVVRAAAGASLDTPRVEALAPLYGWRTEHWFTNLNTPGDYLQLSAVARLSEAESGPAQPVVRPGAQPTR